jgi:hypothetical protein
LDWRRRAQEREGGGPEAAEAAPPSLARGEASAEEPAAEGADERAGSSGQGTGGAGGPSALLKLAGLAGGRSKPVLRGEGGSARRGVSGGRRAGASGTPYGGKGRGGGAAGQGEGADAGAHLTCAHRRQLAVLAGGRSPGSRAAAAAGPAGGEPSGREKLSSGPRSSARERSVIVDILGR